MYTIWSHHLCCYLLLHFAHFVVPDQPFTHSHTPESCIYSRGLEHFYRKLSSWLTLVTFKSSPKSPLLNVTYFLAAPALPVFLSSFTFFNSTCVLLTNYLSNALSNFLYLFCLFSAFHLRKCSVKTGILVYFVHCYILKQNLAYSPEYTPDNNCEYI